MRPRTAVVILSLVLSTGVAQAQPVPPFDLEIFEGGRPLVTGPTDQRFFGAFCQPEPRQFCKKIVLFNRCVTVSDMFIQMNHLTMPDGGLLQGEGRFLLDGKKGTLVVAGNVVARARARVAAVAPGLGQQLGEATLSSNGLRLTAVVQGRSIVLRKDACGNKPPAVALTAPFGPTFPFGQSIMLAGNITDEDTTFPPERLVFTSNKQGLIPGTRVAGGRTLFTTALQPGSHRVTLTVTDSGGLMRQASLDLTVLNRPPETPRIFLPAVNATLVVGAPVLLQGSALDPDSGMLSGAALTWTAQLTPGAPFVPLGSGSDLGTVFSAPGDPVVIRLTANDGTNTSQADRHVRVVPSTGNAPPVVVIQQPDRRQATGPVVAIYLAGVPAHLVAAASDVESAGPDLQFRWEFLAVQGPGGAPDPNPPVPNPAPVTGTLAPTVTFPVSPGGERYYRLIFTATDAGGLSSSDSIEVAVSSSGPIL